MWVVSGRIGPSIPLSAFNLAERGVLLRRHVGQHCGLFALNTVCHETVSSPIVHQNTTQVSRVLQTVPGTQAANSKSYFK